MESSSSFKKVAFKALAFSPNQDNHIVELAHLEQAGAHGPKALLLWSPFQSLKGSVVVPSLRCDNVHGGWRKTWDFDMKGLLDSTKKKVYNARQESHLFKATNSDVILDSNNECNWMNTSTPTHSLAAMLPSDPEWKRRLNSFNCSAVQPIYSRPSRKSLALFISLFAIWSRKTWQAKCSTLLYPSVKCGYTHCV